MAIDKGEIFILDDDPSIRKTISIILSVSGYKVTAFADGASLLAACRRCSCICILLDLYLPGSSGIGVLKKLKENCTIPVIMISGHADISVAVQAIKLGAYDFLEKPFAKTELLDCLDELSSSSAIDESLLQFPGSEILTSRECAIVPLLANGLTSKEIARQLGISPRTVESKRARIMRKLNAKTLTELLRAAYRKPT